MEIYIVEITDKLSTAEKINLKARREQLINEINANKSAIQYIEKKNVEKADEIYKINKILADLTVELVSK